MRGIKHKLVLQTLTLIAVFVISTITACAAPQAAAKPTSKPGDQTVDNQTALNQTRLPLSTVESPLRIIIYTDFQ